MIEILNQNYRLPVLRVYEVTDFDKKYYKPKALEKHIQKRNLEYQREYDRNLEKYNKCVEIVTNKIDPLPDVIKTLFRRVLSKQLEYVDTTHELYLQKTKELLDEYDKKPNPDRVSAYDLMRTLLNNYLKYDYTAGKYDLLKKAELLARYPNLEGYDYDKMHRDFSDYEKLKSHDLVLRYSTKEDAKNFILQDILSRLEDISDEIKRVFGGRYPDTCETDVNFGVGGRFNGILKLGDVKMSFKSFIAGGYNIQREHIRFKITKLVR